MFSQSQILQDLPKQFFVNLVAKVNAKQAEGYDVINLGQGNPDQPTYDFIVDALIASAKNPVSHKYSSFRGNAHFKEAVSQFYREHYQVDLNSEKEICVLGGAKIGLVEFPLALMNPGDLLLLPDPGYPDYLSSVALAQIDYATFPLTKANHFLPDLTAIPEDVAKRAKFIYVNYPNNPTGAVALLDERSKDAVADLNKTYDERRRAFVQAAEKIGWHAFDSKGSFYAWMPVPEGYDSEQFADLLLNEAHVAVAPGKAFGKQGDSYVRIGLLVDPERLVEAVERIGKLHLFEKTSSHL